MAVLSPLTLRNLGTLSRVSHGLSIVNPGRRALYGLMFRRCERLADLRAGGGRRAEGTGFAFRIP